MTTTAITRYHQRSFRRRARRIVERFFFTASTVST
jgi:hypothetical protein